MYYKYDGKTFQLNLNSTRSKRLWKQQAENVAKLQRNWIIRVKQENQDMYNQYLNDTLTYGHTRGDVFDPVEFDIDADDPFVNLYNDPVQEAMNWVHNTTHVEYNIN